MSEYTGPLGPTPAEWEAWYHRFKDFCSPLQLRQYGIACHPQDKQLMVDQLERLLEDDTWPHKEVPPLVTSDLVPRLQVQPVSLATLKLVPMREVLGSRKGFGRYAGLRTPGRDGLHDPWKEGLKKASPASRKRLLKPDGTEH